MLKLGLSEHDYVLVEETKYCSYLRAFLQEDALLQRKLVQSVLPSCRDVSISYQLMADIGVTESQLR